jgi:hypothetical protein
MMIRELMSAIGQYAHYCAAQNGIAAGVPWITPPEKQSHWTVWLRHFADGAGFPVMEVELGARYLLRDVAVAQYTGGSTKWSRVANRFLLPYAIQRYQEKYSEWMAGTSRAVALLKLATKTLVSNTAYRAFKPSERFSALLEKHDVRAVNPMAPLLERMFVATHARTLIVTYGSTSAVTKEVSLARDLGVPLLFVVLVHHNYTSQIHLVKKRMEASPGARFSIDVVGASANHFISSADIVEDNPLLCTRWIYLGESSSLDLFTEADLDPHCSPPRAF